MPVRQWCFIEPNRVPDIIYHNVFNGASKVTEIGNQKGEMPHNLCWWILNNQSEEIKIFASKLSSINYPPATAEDIKKMRKILIKWSSAIDRNKNVKRPSNLNSFWPSAEELEFNETPPDDLSEIETGSWED